MAVGDAPTSGEVEYEWSPWRYVVASAALGFVGAAVGWLSLSVLFSAIAGRPGIPAMGNGATFVPVYTISFAAFALFFSRGRRAGLRFAGGAIEMAAARHDPVLVPYAAVTGARLRGIWPVAMLDVFVDSADESRVMRGDRAGRRPIRRRKGNQLRFSMPIAGLRTSAADIRSELRRRGLGE